MEQNTQEPQYQVCLTHREQHGLTNLGLMTNYTWHHDPRHLVFTLSRYKFAAKMLSGSHKVLEVGCADAFASRIVQQEVGELTVLDIDPIFIEDVRARMDPRWPVQCLVHNVTQGEIPGGPYDGAYSLDVLEHIPPEQEHLFMTHLSRALSPHGVLILGMPSLQSQAHASAPSREGHVNCKDARDLKRLASEYFHNVFSFSMNDEVVHTGFHAMAHYLLVVCCGRRTQPD